MKDVASLAGVSLSTVSRVVTGSVDVRPDLTMRVQDAVDVLGYRRDLTASNLRRTDRLSSTIGLIIEDVANPFFSAVHRGVEDVARSRSVLTFAGSSDEDPARERELTEAFLGRRVEVQVDVDLPGRLERRPGGEVWDGAHNPAGVAWLAAHLEPGFVVCASILGDKDTDAMLAGLARLGRTLIATQSSNERALAAAELARAARPHFDHIEVVPDPEAALDRARALGRPLVTGSLYLLADLSRSGGRRERAVR
jgi:LacI family transcriptional regulator